MYSYAVSGLQLAGWLAGRQNMGKFQIFKIRYRLTVFNKVTVFVLDVWLQNFYTA